MAEKRKLLGEYLVDKGVITPEQLQEAFEESKRSNDKMGDVLVKLGFASEEDIISALSEQLGIAYMNLNTYQVDYASVQMIPEEVARRLNAIAVYRIGGTLTVAMADPLNVDSIDELERLTRLSIGPVFATITGIRAAIDKYYGGPQEFSAQKLQSTAKKSSRSPQSADEERSPGRKDEAAQAPVIELVEKIIKEAVKINASDIHLEPQENGFFWRNRVDGILQTPQNLPKNLQSAVISRIKIMADIDISEKRLPQDGRIQTRIDGKEIDLRVATFPTIHGEHVAIRVLDKSAGVLALGDLGLTGKLFTTFQEMIRRPHGIILVTGPTGSGKSTTLYSALNTINDMKKNIITLEDPVEYTIDNIHQSQVNNKAGLTFAVGLRSIVRLDPDIIMIGEIRDKETAEISIHAALTGHLVFSTLHTNDAPSACARIINIGVEPYLVSSSLSAVLAQRLVRKLCDSCKEAYNPSPEELKKFGITLAPNDEQMTFYKEKGCKECFDIGYKGRIGIYELFIPTDPVRELIHQKASGPEIAAAARQEGMRTLLDDGLDKILAGVTSVSEVLRVTQEA